MSEVSPEKIAGHVRQSIPEHGLFAGMDWRISPRPFELDAKIISELEKLGRVLLQFNKAINHIYRKSAEGKAPEWLARYLDLGKPAELINLQRSREFKNDFPRVIRPDILLTDEGLKITELDSVPGGIGLTGWLNKTYAQAAEEFQQPWNIAGGKSGMQSGFNSIFGNAARVRVLISKESETYAPEMEWIADEIGSDRVKVADASFKDFEPGEAVYRFFELFDLPNIRNSLSIFARAAAGEISVTPPPKPVFEEKMLLALLWNGNLKDLWRQELGDGFFNKLRNLVPYSWIVDPAPMPPHAAIPELNLTNWEQLKTLSQKERNLILKISGFAESAWGARGVYLGSDLSSEEWGGAVDRALREFEQHPYVLQRYHKPSLHKADYWDFEKGTLVPMEGRVRLCPYYFVSGSGDQARAQLGGILATICPADKKIIHGMKDAILAPVMARAS